VSDTAGAGKKVLGFLGETYREIIAKAVCGTARRSLKYTHYIEPPQDSVPSQILGCSVTELLLQEPEVKESGTGVISIRAEGNFEIHVWYARNNGKETDVLRHPVKFEEFLPLDDFDCQSTGLLDAKITVEKSPVVLATAITENQRIKLDMELEISATVIGETKLLIKNVYVPDLGDVSDDQN